MGRWGGKIERFDPTPQEIAAACAAIQSEWSEQERLSRLRVDQRPQYTRCDGIPEQIGANDYIGHHATRERLQGVSDD